MLPYFPGLSFQGMSSERLRMMLFNAYLRDNREGNSISVHGNPSDEVILIHGNVTSYLIVIMLFLRNFIAPLLYSGRRRYLNLICKV